MIRKSKAPMIVRVFIAVAVGMLLTLGVGAVAQQVIKVNPAAFASGGYGEKLVLTTATLMGGPLSGRRAIALDNKGGTSIFCGYDNLVTTGTGYEVPGNGGTLSIDATDAITVYCIASGNQTAGAGTRYMEIR